MNDFENTDIDQQQELSEEQIRANYVPKYAAPSKNAEKKEAKRIKQAEKSKKKEEKQKLKEEKKKNKAKKQDDAQASDEEIVRVRASDDDKKEEVKDSKRKRPSLKLILGFIASVILIAGVIFVAFFTQDNGTVTIKKIKPNSPFPISLTDEIKKVEITKKCIYVLSGTNLSCYDEKGEQLNEFKLSYSAPRITASDTYALVYDSQGNGFSVCKGTELSYSRKSKDECQIICAEIGKKGDVTVVTRPQNSSGTASVLTYYDSSGNEEFSWLCKDYIISVRVSDNSQHILAAALNSNLVDIYTQLYIIPVNDFSAKNDSTLFSKKFKSPFIDMSFHGNKGVAICLKDKLIRFSIGSYDKSKKSVNFKGTLLFNCSDGSGHTAVVTNTNTKNVLFVYNKNCELVYKMKLKGNIKDIKNIGKKVYVLFENSAMLVSSEDKSKTLAEFDIIQKALALYGKDVYNYSSNMLFSKI